MARAGAGSYEYFDSKAKSKWEHKTRGLIEKARQPGLTSVKVSWEQHGAEDDSPPVQAPAIITAVFNGSRQVVYGFVPNCTQVGVTGVDRWSTGLSLTVHRWVLRESTGGLRVCPQLYTGGCYGSRQVVYGFVPNCTQVCITGVARRSTGWSLTVHRWVLRESPGGLRVCP